MMHQDLAEKNLSASTAIFQGLRFPKQNQRLNQTSDHSRICNRRRVVTAKAISMPLIRQVSLVVLPAVCLTLINARLPPKLQISCKVFLSLL